MKKVSVLLFVIVLLLGCQKSRDAEFEKEVAKIKEWYGIEILLEKERTNFDVFESLSGVETKSYKPLVRVILFDDKKLDRENINLKEALKVFVQHKYKTKVADHGVVDSTKVFSIIQILKSTTEDIKLSNEEQFFEMVNALEEFPNYFSQAKNIVKNPSQMKLEEAIQQYSQDYFYLKNELSLLIRKPDLLKEDQFNFSQKNEMAQLAVKDFIAFLNSQLFELSNK